MTKFDELRAALRTMDGKICAFESPTLLGIIAELRRSDVSDQRLKALQRPAMSGQSASSRPTLSASSKPGKYTALVSMRGVALYSLDFPPYCFSTLNFARTVAQLASDPSIDQIVLDIDTPGGHVTGTQEAADAVWNARKKKPVTGIVNPLCASAGYWIASQCSSIVAVPSADIGSIGVFMCHFDYSAMLADAGVKPTFIYAGKNKTEGNAMEPLGAEAKAWFQSEVDKTYRDFLGAVARGRNTSSATVQGTFGGGRCLIARDALRAGMVDAIATPDAAMTNILSGGVTARSTPSASAVHRAAIAEAQRGDPPSTEQIRALLAMEALR